LSLFCPSPAGSANYLIVVFRVDKGFLDEVLIEPNISEKLHSNKQQEETRRASEQDQCIAGGGFDAYFRHSLCRP